MRRDFFGLSVIYNCFRSLEIGGVLSGTRGVDCEGGCQQLRASFSFKQLTEFRRLLTLGKTFDVENRIHRNYDLRTKRLEDIARAVKEPLFATGVRGDGEKQTDKV